jgi:hypothetical protein
MMLAAAMGLTATGGVGEAAAQQSGATPPGATQWQEAEDESAMVAPFNVTVDDLEEMHVYGPGGGEIGEVEDVLAGPGGQPGALAVEAGGFLGVGDRTVVVGLDQLRAENDRLVTGLTKEQIEGLPEWDD